MKQSRQDEIKALKKAHDRTMQLGIATKVITKFYEYATLGLDGRDMTPETEKQAGMLVKATNDWIVPFIKKGELTLEDLGIIAAQVAPDAPKDLYTVMVCEAMGIRPVFTGPYGHIVEEAYSKLRQ